VLCAILVLVSLVSLASGPARVGFPDIIALAGGGEISPQARDVLLKLRLPRLALGLLVGWTLGMTGAGLQGLLRNPLADPYLLGVSAGAAVVAVLAGLLGVPQTWTPVISFLGALITMAAVWRVGTSPTGTRPGSLLLAGVMTNLLLGAVISLLLALGGREFYRTVQVLLGGLGTVVGRENLYQMGVALVLVVIGSSLALARSRQLDALSLGEDSAEHLGVRVESLSKVLFLATSVSVGAVVALSGLIGFVGLVVPHMVRRVVGPSHARVLPLAGLAGAAMLVVADTLARTVSPTELPVGAVTALVGAPVFLVLMKGRSFYQ
jgi:iron complex transport system permease protein